MPLVPFLSNLAKQTYCADLTGCEATLKQAAAQQRSMVDALLDEGLVDESRFLSALSASLEIPWRNEPIITMPPALREKFPVRLALRHRLLPLSADETSIQILTYDPFDLLARQAVAQAIPEKVTWAMSTRRQILQALRQGYGVGAETFDQILAGRDDADTMADLKQETNVLDAEDSEASVVKFVNQIIREALEQRATDIHFEPVQDDLRVRYRIDGVLHEIPVPAQMKVLQASVISRLKIMAHLDIAEKRLPQDGRINLELEGHPIDVRVATIPSVIGESVSLRLLGQERFDLARLGLDEVSQGKIRYLLDLPNGIVLLTGPTGCGKSTTLYTFLSSLNVKERRIVTIEEPVEHQVPGVIQMAIRPEIDFTFAKALRSILRGDPNVIMVGEMRDFETAEIAIRAALTGHLVFSTLHTNDAIGGITRLIDMGVEPFLVGSAVRAFIAQRLLRVLCPECKGPARHSEPYLKTLRFPLEHAHALLKANGCERCHHTGYKGRTAIFEICMVSPRLQELIAQKMPANFLWPVAKEDGMVTLREYGWRKVIDGVTTIEEVVRVTASDVRLLDE
ncbi:MAG: type II/IV secretion system protein [Verrucomicrobia bacterium]|nr:type II/IV secretion system protein [Verrucomicrobiota bacterium]